MLSDKLKKFNVILASKSPRRQFLLKEAGINFSVHVNDSLEELFPEHLKREEVALYLAELKAKHFDLPVDEKTIVITADTIVWLNNEVINKPVDREDAIKMIHKLSGNTHYVYSGVCIFSKNKKHTFFSSSEVIFRKLSDEEIIYYVDTFSPFDKAGAYGIQEWIGYVGIKEIKGSYFNVMGLPIQKLYCELEKFVSNI